MAIKNKNNNAVFVFFNFFTVKYEKIMASTLNIIEGSRTTNKFKPKILMRNAVRYTYKAL